MSDRVNYSWISLRNDYMWKGVNPDQGAVFVYVDGKRSGPADLESVRKVPVYSGKHTVRVRLWWFLSPRVTVNVNAGHTVYFRCDMPMNRSFFYRMAKGMFDPFHLLVLEEVGGNSGYIPVTGQ
jgi:hypothetical protein